MDLTASSKVAAAGAAVVLTTGFALIIRSASVDSVAGSIGGACLVMVALSLSVLILVKHWVTSTSDERRVLNAAQRETLAEQSSCIAARAALEIEHGRRTQDMAAERARDRATLRVEREKMRTEFEGTRATELAEAFQTGAQMERAGMLRRQPPEQGNLLKFPGKQAEHQPEEGRARSREHGVAGT